MTAGVKIESGSCDPNHALLGVVCHPKANCKQHLTILALAISEISPGPQKFKVGDMTLTTPILRVICHSYAGTWLA